MAELSDLTAQCIRCGFCLESCPTFAISGNEAESPRGRIYLVRSMDEGVLEWSAENKRPLDTCVGCRACETACPSGVKYGEILEQARDRFESRGIGKPGVRRLLSGVTIPGRLRLQLFVGKALGLRRMPSILARTIADEPQEADLPQLARPVNWPPLDEAAMPPINGKVQLLRGCAMGVLFPDVHAATERLLRRVGYHTERIEGCCGALHAHNGQLSTARAMASSLPATAVVITNSAGCGSWLKEAWSGTEVYDASEFLFACGLAEALEASAGLPGLRVAYHDACHLAHGQGVRVQPRALLSAIPGIELVPLEESDMCCGSGGIYNLSQPLRARKLLERKWSNIDESAASVVATGNPGCLAWIEQASREHGGKVRVVHTLSLLEASFSGNLP